MIRNFDGKISAQPHTTLCIQFLDRENNNKNNTLPLRKQICFSVAWAVRKFYHFDEEWLVYLVVRMEGFLHWLLDEAKLKATLTTRAIMMVLIIETIVMITRIITNIVTKKENVPYDCEKPKDQETTSWKEWTKESWQWDGVERKAFDANF